MFKVIKGNGIDLEYYKIECLIFILDVIVFFKFGFVKICLL